MVAGPTPARWPFSLKSIQRTVHRDLDCLRYDLGAPLEFDRDRNGYFYSDLSWHIPFQQLSEGEVLALFLGERLLQQYEGTPFADDLARLFRKITAALPDPVTLNLEHLAQAYSFRVQATDAGEAEQFRKLLRAVERHRRLELLYWSASRDETLSRVVDPYHLASVDGDWYLLGFCHLREEVRMFSPLRIRELRETGETFECPTPFCRRLPRPRLSQDARRRAAQTVRLRFTPTAARWVREKKWHVSQMIEEHADGSLTLSFAVNHLAEVKTLGAVVWGGMRGG